MNARSLFLVPFLVAVYGALALGGWLLWTGTAPLQGVALLVVGVPYGVWFARLMLWRFSTSAPGLPLQRWAGMLGAGMAILAAFLEGPSWLALVLALSVGWVGIPAYALWYSRLDRSSSLLVEGAPLPPFQLQSVDGEAVPSSELYSSLLVFFRGNWCPLCVTQIQEVAERYQALHERGVQVVLISGQSEANTRSLAASFHVPMTHLLDPDLATAKQLGLFHQRALPLGTEVLHPSAEADAYLPTVALVDRDGVVRWLDATDNYRVRPHPDTFLQQVERVGVEHFGAA